jgi:hypothetical protein
VYESPEYCNPEFDPIHKNLIILAFWTCLQLERYVSYPYNVRTDIGSDILAEVNLPPSGISRLERLMQNAMPTIETLRSMTSFPDEAKNNAEILRYYCCQIQLRRTLNTVHSHLYKVPSPTCMFTAHQLFIFNSDPESAQSRHDEGLERKPGALERSIRCSMGLG